MADKICITLNIDNINSSKSVVDNVNLIKIAGLNTTKINEELAALGVEQSLEAITEIVIPNTIIDAQGDSWSVNEIASELLSNCKNLTSITIPFVGRYRQNESNPNLWSSAYCFYQLFGSSASAVPSNLSEVHITDEIIFSENAFYNCQSIIDLYLPKSIINSSNNAFKGCKNLKNVYYTGSVEDYAAIDFQPLYANPLMGSIDTAAAISEESGANLYIKGIDDTYQLLENIITEDFSHNKLIKVCAFAGCRSLSTLELSEIDTVNAYAFSYCVNLSHVDFNNDLRTLGNQAFYNCISLDLSQVIFNDGLIDIQTDVFTNCDESKMTPVNNNYYIPSLSNPFAYLHKCLIFDEQSENTCLSVAAGTLHPDVKIIGCNSLKDNLYLTDVDLQGSSVVCIGGRAFQGCSSLAAITLHEDLLASGSDIVTGCSKFRTIYLTVAEDGALHGGLTSWLNFAPDSCGHLSAQSDVYDFTLESLVSLKDRNGNILSSDASVSASFIDIDTQIKKIKPYAFAAFSWMSAIHIPNSVIEIGEGAFILNSGSIKTYSNTYIAGLLKRIYIDSAEHWCSIEMPYEWLPQMLGSSWESPYAYANPLWTGGYRNPSDSYRYIKDLYIYDYENLNNSKPLSDIHLPESITRIPDGRFNYCRTIKTVKFPNKLQEIGDLAFACCINLHDVKIGYPDIDKDKQVHFGISGFYGCENILNVYFDGRIEDWLTKYWFDYHTYGYDQYESNPLIGAHFFYLGNCIKAPAPDETVTYTQLVDLVIPESAEIKTIPGFAFAGFTGFSSITIPNTVHTIGIGAFINCRFNTLHICSRFFDTADDSYKLTYLSDYIGGKYYEGFEDSFYLNSESARNCYEVHFESEYLDRPLEIQESIANYATAVLNCTPEFLCNQPSTIYKFDGFVFKSQDDADELLIGYYGRVSDVIFPHKNTPYVVADTAFYKNKFITSITTDENVSKIKVSAFRNCTVLAEVILDDAVIELAQSCFSGCQNITGILNIPGSIKVIGAYAFKDCSNITSAILNEGIETLESSCFQSCTRLASIYLPASLKESYNKAFTSCSNLMNVYYSGSISNWCNNILFENQQSNPLAIRREGTRFYLKDRYHQYNEVTHLILPQDVESLSPYIFYYCTRFNQLTILGQIKAISETAFAHESYPDVKVKFTDVYINDIKSWCQTYIPTASANPLNGANLHIKDTNSDNYILATKIELPLYTQELRSYIFYGCKSIETITLNTYLEFIGEDALNSTYLKNIEYNGTINQWLEVKLPYAIINSTSPPNIKILKDGAYSDIVDIDLTDYNITHIYRGTFEYSKTLTSIKFPRNLKSLDAYAFRGCTKLNHIEFTGNDLKVLPDYLFSKTALDSFDIPDGVETVGYYSFNTNSYLKSIRLPKSVKNIGNIGATLGQTAEHPFSLYIDDLAHFLSLPSGGDGLTGIFRYHLCSKFVSLYLKNASGSYDEIHTLQIPESISKLSSYSIIGNNVKEVFIPESVSFIADDAFASNLTNLTSLTLPESLKYDRHLEVLDSRFNLPEPNFNDPDAEQLYTIKDDCAYIKTLNNDYFYLYKASIDATEEIVISTSTKYIGPQAFAGCKNITKIVIPDSVINIGYEAFKDCTGLIDIQLPLNSDLSIDGNAFINYASSTYTPLNYQTGSQLVTTEYANGCYLGNEDNPYLMLLSVNKSTITTDSEIIVDDQLIDLPKNTIRVHKNTQYLSSCLFGSEAKNIIFEANPLQIKHIPFRMLNSSTSYKIFTADVNGFLSIPTSYNCTSQAVSWLLYDGTDIDSATVVTELHIPENIKRLNGMFYRYGSNLQSIYLPHNLNKLYDYELGSKNIHVYYNGTLQDWCKLDKSQYWAYDTISLHLKHNIEDIDYYNVADLDIIEIKDVEEVKAYSFYRVDIKAEAQLKFDDKLKIIGKSAFAGTPIKTVIFVDSLEYIDSSAFSSCTNINVLEFPPSLKTIGSNAFHRCSNLSDIYILGPTNIGASAFSQCSKLKDVNLGEQTKSISSGSFASIACDHIDIPTSCLAIGTNAFSSQVTSIDINSREVLIDPKAFSSSVNQITINHDTLLYDGNWGAYNAKVLYKDSPEYFSQGFEFKAINDDEEAFEIIGIGSCVDTYLLIPPKYRQRPVITIKDSAFANNTKIKGLKLSSKNLNIEANAFKNCSNLDYVNCNKLDPCILDATALSGCNLTDLRIEVPKNALDIYKAADGWKDFADYITSNYYILSIEKDLNYRIGNVGASLRAKTGYKGSYTFAEMSKRISDIETYFVDASDEDIIPENIKHEVDINGVIGTFSSDATASADDILENTVAYSKGEKLVGTILRNDVSDISTDGAVLDIPKGYYENTNIELKSLADGELSAPNIEISDDKIYSSVTVSKDGFIDSTDTSEAVYDLNQNKVAISTPQISVSEDGQVTAAVAQSVSGWVVKDTTAQAMFDLSDSWVKREELVTLSFYNTQSFTCFALRMPEDQSMTFQINTLEQGKTTSIRVPKGSTVVVYSGDMSAIQVVGDNVAPDSASHPNMAIIASAPEIDCLYNIYGL